MENRLKGKNFCVCGNVWYNGSRDKTEMEKGMNAALTDNKNFWYLPAAWKAVVQNGKIQLWQVICGSKAPFDIMNN